ncbi:unnamed protein product [Urochloa humidicola]
MMVYIKSTSKKIWKIVDEGYVVLDPNNPTTSDDDNEGLNDQALNLIYSCLSVNEFNRIKNLKTAFEVWERFKEIYEGTTTVKGAKLFVYKGKFCEFAMKKDESVDDMFDRLNNIVNKLKSLNFDVPDQDFSHKFLKCLPEKYETIVTLLVREDLSKMTPSEVLGEVKTHDIFKRSQKEACGSMNDDEKKSKEYQRRQSCEDAMEEMAVIVKKLNRS